MNFNKLVKLTVEPTLLFFGFTIKQDIQGILEYEHKYLVIAISYDYSSSYEVDITLLFKRNDSFYGYSELIEYFYGKKTDSFAIQIKEERTLVKWLEEVNRFLKDNLSSIINNHMEVQIGLDKIRQRQIDIYDNRRNDRLLNEGVEKYWGVKDYPGLVKFLENHKGEFEGSIQKKYEYALKMISEK